MPKNKPESDEKDFQSEIRKTGWFKEYVKEYGEEPDLNTSDYDYRSAWKAGVRPVRDPYDKNKYHWSSSNPDTGEMLKSKDHPTAWKEEYMKSTGKNPDEAGVTKEQYMQQSKPKMAMGGSVESPVSVPVQPPQDPSPLVIPKFEMAKGGTVAKQTQRMLKEGGMMQEGGTVDPVSGNDVPTGAMQEEVRDDIPAQLSEGEFVFPADVVRYIGLERLMMMRQAAKKGLGKMEDMGQMSNADEATEEDTSEFESEIDEIIGVLGGREPGEKEDVEMAVGGMATDPAAMAQTQEALAQDQQPQNAALTEDQLSAINLTAEGMKAQQIEVPPEKQSQPTANLKSSDIIRGNLAQSRSPEEVNQFLEKAAKLEKTKKMINIRHNDTVIMGFVKSPGVVDPIVFSTDTPERLQQAIAAGFFTAQKAGIKRLESSTANPQVMQLLQDMGYPAEDLGEKGWALTL
jgi:hypothetical protein